MWVAIGVPPTTFVQRIREVVPITDLYIGMIKAPVFGAIIAIAGCFQGMLVEGDAEQVGARTTAAVVQAIFLVIVLDAFFRGVLHLAGVELMAHPNARTSDDVVISGQGPEEQLWRAGDP